MWGCQPLLTVTLKVKSFVFSLLPPSLDSSYPTPPRNPSSSISDSTTFLTLSSSLPVNALSTKLKALIPYLVQRESILAIYITLSQTILYFLLLQHYTPLVLKIASIDRCGRWSPSEVRNPSIFIWADNLASILRILYFLHLYDSESLHYTVEMSKIF